MTTPNDPTYDGDRRYGPGVNYDDVFVDDDELLPPLDDPVFDFSPYPDPL